ncbi:hypothetical protein [Streptomyces sp. SID4985]|uniref:hypothetical protein n=1 Tax=Streptomyces sp. SID4985 TaxID=2690292 RepID=UPI001F184B0E|nr:hypothetical protein [Streptomyces sp. SID4985]
MTSTNPRGRPAHPMTTGGSPSCSDDGTSNGMTDKDGAPITEPVKPSPKGT